MITWWGHAMASIELAGAHLLTDPLLHRWTGPLRWHGPPPPRTLPGLVDAVLVSHLHRDHLDLRSLAAFGPRTALVVPRGSGRLVARVARGPVHEIAAGEELLLGDVTVRAVPAEHRSGRHPLGMRADPLGYLVSGDGRTVYFAGDTALSAAMSRLGPVDVALLPVGGWGLTLGAGHLNPSTAVEAIRRIGPRTVVPVHYATLRVPLLWRARPALSTRPGAELARLARDLPGVSVALGPPGRDVPLPARPRER